MHVFTYFIICIYSISINLPNTISLAIENASGLWPGRWQLSTNITYGEVVKAFRVEVTFYWLKDMTSLKSIIDVDALQLSRMMFILGLIACALWKPPSDATPKTEQVEIWARKSKTVLHCVPRFCCMMHAKYPLFSSAPNKMRGLLRMLRVCEYIDRPRDIANLDWFQGHKWLIVCKGR